MFTTGLIGGILSTLAAIYATFYGLIETLAGEGSKSATAGNLIGIAIGVVGIVAASTSKRNRKLSSILMIVSGIGGAIFVDIYPVASVILVIAGLIGLIKKERNSKNVPA